MKLRLGHAAQGGSGGSALCVFMAARMSEGSRRPDAADDLRRARIRRDDLWRSTRRSYRPDDGFNTSTGQDVQLGRGDRDTGAPSVCSCGTSPIIVTVCELGRQSTPPLPWSPHRRR